MLSRPFDGLVLDERYFIALYFIRSHLYLFASTQTPPLPHPPSSRSRTHSVKRPTTPHIVIQIVEMGFSVLQATKALSTTKDGVDMPVVWGVVLNVGGVCRWEQRNFPPTTTTKTRTLTRTRQPKQQPPLFAVLKRYKERKREREREQMHITQRSTTDSIPVLEIQLDTDNLLSRPHFLLPFHQVSAMFSLFFL